MTTPAATGSAKNNPKGTAAKNQPASSPATNAPATNAQNNGEQGKPGNPSVIIGEFDPDGVLPPIQNRGRHADEVPGELAAQLERLLNGGTKTISGTVSQIGKHKRTVKKWLAQQKKDFGREIEPNYRTHPDAKPTATEPGKVTYDLKWHNRPRETNK